jgi:hypothetical protein
MGKGDVPFRGTDIPSVILSHCLAPFTSCDHSKSGQPHPMDLEVLSMRRTVGTASTVDPQTLLDRVHAKNTEPTTRSPSHHPPVFSSLPRR